MNETASASEIHHDPELEASVRRGHEYGDLRWRTIVAVGLALFLMTIVALLLVAGVLRSHEFSQAPGIPATEQWRLQDRAPGVQPNQAYTRQQLDEMTRQQLTGYAWQRDDHSVARIPIERAMQILAERELKADFSSKTQQDAEAIPEDKDSADAARADTSGSKSAKSPRPGETQ